MSSWPIHPWRGRPSLTAGFISCGSTSTFWTVKRRSAWIRCVGPLWPSSMAIGFLQMDIEGAEYRVLLDASEDTLKRIRVMVIEFHHLTQAFGRFPLELIKATFAKLLRFHYVVHAHPNNICDAAVRGDLAIPPVMEVTFHRKDRTNRDEGRSLTFPLVLDADNLPGRPSVVLPFAGNKPDAFKKHAGSQRGSSPD